MAASNNTKTLFLIIIGLICSLQVFSQDIKIGIRDSLQSKTLNENRNILIRLPSDYYKSNKDYPVIYRLDGDIDMFIETVGVVYRLSYREEIMSDMIVVMIENTNRNRDMWPVKTKYYKSEPGAADFHSFIKSELIPYIENKYRTTKDRVLCGQSLSSVFTIYSFLKDPNLFNSYIACSAGFPDCEPYFLELTNKAMEEKPKIMTKLFISNGLQDFLDPKGIQNAQIINFTNIIKVVDNISCKYAVYDNEGHVPYQSLYHGLKFIYDSRNEYNEIKP